jgi:hypothetical protein
MGTQPNGAGVEVMKNYPNIAAAKKYQRKGGLSNLTRAEVRAYGETVLHGIRQLQRRELSHASTYGQPCPCASGTWESDGAKILEHIKRQANAG